MRKFHHRPAESGTRLPGSLICYGLPVCSPSCKDPTGFPTVEDFYFQAFNEIGPLLDMTTTVTRLLLAGLNTRWNGS
jgi:hypothetical protein